MRNVFAMWLGLCLLQAQPAAVTSDGIRFRGEVVGSAEELWKACSAAAKLASGAEQLTVEFFAVDRAAMEVNRAGLPNGASNSRKARHSYAENLRSQKQAEPYCEVFSYSHKVQVRKVYGWNRFSEEGTVAFQEALLGKDLAKFFRLVHFDVVQPQDKAQQAVSLFFALQDGLVDKGQMERLAGRVRGMLGKLDGLSFLWSGHIQEVDGFPAASPLHADLVRRLEAEKAGKIYSCIFRKGRFALDCKVLPGLPQ